MKKIFYLLLDDATAPRYFKSMNKKKGTWDTTYDLDKAKKFKSHFAANQFNAKFLYIFKEVSR